jgi:hypothetical protein
MRAPEHLCLGYLIAELESQEADLILPIGFRNPHSYRGDYMDLAFEIAENVTVGEMLTSARSALGVTFQGYKGRDYRMDKLTPVWLAEDRHSTGETLGRVLLHLLLRAGSRPRD